MNRLPGNLRESPRLELVAFIGVGLASLMLIAITAHDALNFARSRDYITAALMREPDCLAALSPTNHALPPNPAVMPVGGVAAPPGRTAGASSPAI